MAHVGDLIVTGSSRFLNKIYGACTDGSVVSSQDRSTKFLRQDGTWSAPSYPNQTDISEGSGISVSVSAVVGRVTYTISNSGVRSVATGGSNGTISVNTNGTATDVAVKGLGSAAYTASTAYLASTTTYAGSSSVGGAATSAAKLTNTAKIGDANKPVYFTASGVPSSISYTIDKSVPSTAVFTDANVTQTATTTNAKYEILFSGTADDTTRTEGARKSANLTYWASEGRIFLKHTSVPELIVKKVNSSDTEISSMQYLSDDVSYSGKWDGTNVSLKNALSAKVSSVKVGTTSYSPSSGVVSLPAYPSTASDVGALPSTTTYAGSATVGGQATRTCLYTSRQASANLTAGGTVGLSHFLATSTMTTGKPNGDAHILHMMWDNNGGYDAQLAAIHGGQYHLEYRAQNSGTWQDWKTVIDSSGGTMTGTLYLKSGGIVEVWNSAETSKVRMDSTTSNNRGIYDVTSSKWLVYSNNGTHRFSDYTVGNTHRPIYFANGVPTVGNTIQYSGSINSGTTLTVPETMNRAFIVLGRKSQSTTCTAAFLDQWGGLMYLSTNSNFTITATNANGTNTIKLKNAGSAYISYFIIGSFD